MFLTEACELAVDLSAEAEKVLNIPTSLDTLDTNFGSGKLIQSKPRGY